MFFGDRLQFVFKKWNIAADTKYKIAKCIKRKVITKSKGYPVRKYLICKSATMIPEKTADFSQRLLILPVTYSAPAPIKKPKIILFLK